MTKHGAAEIQVIAFTETGATVGCPFCKGRMIYPVEQGKYVVLLSGLNAGRIFQVLADHPSSSDYFLARSPDMPPGTSRMISYSRDRFTIVPFDKIPDWMLSLSVDDANALEESIISGIVNAAGDFRISDSELLARHLIACAWRRRLPVSGFEIAKVLLAHGLPNRMVEQIPSLFEFGTSLLVKTIGRPPIKRKRVNPLSIGSYASPSQRKSTRELFVFDPNSSPFVDLE